MPWFVCGNDDCAMRLYSKHSTAKYCSRRCAGIGSMRLPSVRQRHRERMREYTDEELLTRLLVLAAQLGRTPSRRQVRAPAASTYAERFGSYTNAVMAAGLPANRPVPRTYEGERRIISFSLRFTVLQRDGFACQYCGGTPQRGYLLHVDHVVPVIEGGRTVGENLITACWLCNLGKGAAPLDCDRPEFRPAAPSAGRDLAPPARASGRT